MAALEKYAWTKVLRVKNQCIRECLAEVMGTGILVIFACGSGVSYILSGGKEISFLSVNIVSGIAVILAMYMCGGVTGGCYNPAISLAMVLTDRLHWSHLPFHWLGQFSGAFTAAAIVYGVYSEALDNYDGGVRAVTGPTATAGAFCSFPQDYLSARGGLADQCLGAGLLVICGLCIIDRCNLNPHPGLAPIPIGLSVTAIGAAFGFNCGYPINPAKDLGPRLFLLAAGYGPEVFSIRNYNWFWVPIVGPFLGSAAACFIYWIFIELHWPEKVEIQDKDVDVEEPEVSFTQHHTRPPRYTSIREAMEYNVDDAENPSRVDQSSLQLQDKHKENGDLRSRTSANGDVDDTRL